MFKDTIEFKEIHLTKNDITELNKLKKHSNKKIWWVCNKSECKKHEWETTISNRTGENKTFCPYCANRKICPCENKCNSLGYLYPDMIKEWHPKNSKTPFDYTVGSNTKVWWKCDKKCGYHEWKAIINSRFRKNSSNCPYCANRKICPCENKCNSLGYKYSDMIKEWHPKNDKTPFDYFPSSTEKIWWKCDKGCGEHEWVSTINNRTGMTKKGCPICSDKKICSCKNSCNSLGYLYPDLVKEWHPKNDKTPFEYVSGSGINIWWICKKSKCGGHTWKALIGSRTRNNGSGCPICANQKICTCDNKCNSLGYLCPDMIKEWHPKNSKTPFSYTPGSKKKVWWICNKSTCGGHIWEANIDHRARKNKSGCPVCRNLKICTCKNKCNSSGHSHPELSKQWHPTKNDKTSYDYTSGSRKKVWWICSKNKDHIYQLSINDKSKRNCPKCLLCPKCMLWRTMGKLCDYCKPEEKSKAYQKTKEMKVVKYLRKELPNQEFIHNKSVGKDCTNGHLFPDVRFDLITYHLIVEIDEHQHRGASYKCDEQRMYDVIAKLGLPCIFIRYNPDHQDSNLDSNPDSNSDSNLVLLKEIKKYLNEQPTFNDFGLYVDYLYYDD